MIYGLYLSASGLMSNSYRQDVLANNLANSETVGFKRDLAFFQERNTAKRERGHAGDWSDPVQEKIGGGLLASATMVDRRQGDLENTGNPLDMAVEGDGYFAVSAGGKTRLTRSGNMMTNRAGELILANGHNQRVLDINQKPITLQPGGAILVAKDGTISQAGKPITRIGVFDVPNRDKLRQVGGTLLSFPEDTALKQGPGTVRSEFLERANVDPTMELSQLMETQRQLEANANMIRYQDQTLQRLVNDVGKIS